MNRTVVSYKKRQEDSNDTKTHKSRQPYTYIFNDLKIQVLRLLKNSKECSVVSLGSHKRTQVRTGVKLQQTKERKGMFSSFARPSQAYSNVNICLFSGNTPMTAEAVNE